MKKNFIRIITLVIVLSLTLGQFAFADTKEVINVDKENIGYNFKDYLSVLPFKLSKADELKAKSYFTRMNEAFSKGKWSTASDQIEKLYDVIDDYWISEKTFEVLVPLKEWQVAIKNFFTDEQEKAMDKLLSEVKVLRKKKEFKAYFAKIKEIYSFYFTTLGESIGDVNGDYLLIAYIKDGDKVSYDKLIDYTFEDYLSILPFDIEDKDYNKGKAIFGKIVNALEKKNDKLAKNLTKDLNKVILPYWFKVSVRKLVLPHEDYKNNAIKFFDRSEILELEKNFEAVEAARRVKNYEGYFEGISTYYKNFGSAISNYYGDIFGELVFLD